MPRYRLTEEDLENLEELNHQEKYEVPMPKYRLTEEDRQDIEEQSWGDDPEATYGYCDICKVRGEVGTCYTRAPFIHELESNKTPTHNEHHPWYIYCGYGSPWDTLNILLTPQDKALFSGKRYCTNCLKRRLKDMKLILIHNYFEDRYLLLTGKELTEDIKDE